jgi:hypothetical protein
VTFPRLLSMAVQAALVTTLAFAYTANEPTTSYWQNAPVQIQETK